MNIRIICPEVHYYILERLTKKHYCIIQEPAELLIIHESLTDDFNMKFKLQYKEPGDSRVVSVYN